MSAGDNLRIATLASKRAVHAAFAWLHLHEPQLRRWQMECMAIPAPPFGETNRAEWFSKQFTALGLYGTHIDHEGNVLAELQWSEHDSKPDDPVVLLSAHLDTVFPIEVDCTPHENESRILGPGACDNGAGLMGLLGLAAAMKAAQIKPACTILFAANVGEEGEGDLRGMRHLFGRSPYASRIRAAIALEGSGNGTVVDRALGSRRLRVTITGPGGHSWADAGRPNPILALSKALLAISHIAIPHQPRTTVNCGTISGGTSVNSIPSSATADLDLRSVSSLQLDHTELAVLKTLESSMKSEDSGQLHLHVQRIGNRAAGELPGTSPLSRSLRAVDRHLRLTTESRIGSTDANLPLSLGVPALAIGAGGTGGGVHTLDEWYDPTGRDLALRRVLLLLLDASTLASSNSLIDSGA